MIRAGELSHSAAAEAAGVQPQALILGSSVADSDSLPGDVSLEQYEAQQDGFTVTVATDAQWAAMTATPTGQPSCGLTLCAFDQYQLLIIGDPVFGAENPTTGEALSSASVWEPVVMASQGNKFLSGFVSSNAWWNGVNGSDNAQLEGAGIAYAGAMPGATGLYLDMAGAYLTRGARQVSFAILDGLTSYSASEFSVIDGLNYLNGTSHVVATGTQETDAVTGSIVPNETFNDYPPDWTPVTLWSGPFVPGSICGWETSIFCGLPSILATGSGLAANLGPVYASLTAGEVGGASSRAGNQPTCQSSRPVNCATGVFWHTFQDASVPGPGVALDFTRTYSSADASVDGPLGYGWTDSYDMSLSLAGDGNATVSEANGSQVLFYPNGSGGFAGPPRTLASLTANSNGTYTYMRDADHVQYVFNGSGELLSEMDRDGYTTSLSYTGGLLTSVTDAVGRSLTFSYSGSQISQITDPAGDTWTYSYDSSGDLQSVVAQSGSYQTTWQYSYDANHLMDTMTDPDGGVTTNTYDSSAQVVQQQDPAGGITTWSYSGNPATVQGSTTTITDPSGHVTVESYQDLELQAMTKGYGTPQQATTSYIYDSAADPTTVIDPNGYATSNTYDGDGDLLTSTNALGDEWSYTYNAFNEVLTAEDPNAVTTTSTYDADGNLLSKATPLTGGGTATTSYAYSDSSLPGEATAVTDPDGHATSYGYDQYGNVASVTDATGDETTYSHNVIGERTAMVSPAGNVQGANPANYTTTYAYAEAPFEVTKTTNPTGASTSSQYNGNGALTAETDADGNQTTYVLDADDRVTQTNEPGPGSPHTTTSYFPDGTLHTQTDANGKTTTYTEDPLGRIASMTNPAGQTTSYTYDGAGNLDTLQDGEGETTTYAYNGGDQRTSITYSDGQTPNVAYQYDADGDRTQMTDGTGTTTYTYNTLGELTSMTDGHGDVVSYGYDANGNETSIVYPNGKTVTLGFDANERLQNVTDWLSNETTFAYSPDAQLSSTTFPTATGNVDSYGYNDADQLTSTTMKQSASTLASLSYTLDPLGQPTTISQTGLPGAASTSYTYSPQEQLASAGSSSYSYNAAGNPTALASTTLSYDGNGYLQSFTSGSTNVPIQYNADGQRNLGAGPTLATDHYLYDEAGRLSEATPAVFPAAGLIAAGQYHSLAVRVDGTVWAWGLNNDGQLGNNTTTTENAPVQVSSITGATAVAAGQDHSLALKSNGTVWAWGYNNDGQLGNNTTTTEKTPVQVNTITGVSAIAANDSGSHSLALESNGTVWAWGYNNDGQLGNNTTTTEKTPVQVSNITGVSAIAAGGSHSLALKSNGTVWAWGYNNDGQLGNNTTTTEKTPVQVSNITGVSAIAAGNLYSLALQSNGNVWAWGENNDGQLGNGTLTNSEVPVQVSGLSNVVAIAAGAGQSLALESNGTVWAWGNNANGQLGDGSVGGSSSVPVQVAGVLGVGELTGVTAIAAGANHSLFANSSGAMVATGENNDGQLGISSTGGNYGAPRALSTLVGIIPTNAAAFAYNGDGLRTSSAASTAISYDVWNTSGTLPLLLTDGANNYIYGPNGLPVEQISNTGTVTYLHHDQIGSTRLITSSSGAAAGTFTYNPYGTLQASTGTATTPLGYGGQYTDPATGLEYLQARYYDPTTGQFLTVDPIASETGRPYTYATDDPLVSSDPSGLFAQSGQFCGGGTIAPPPLDFISFSFDVCLVVTPGGSGITFTGGASIGAGAGANLHAGFGVSNACTPSDYDGLFNQFGGSYSYETGGYANVFASPPGQGHIWGVNSGLAFGLGGDVGAGPTYTIALPF